MHCFLFNNWQAKLILLLLVTCATQCSSDTTQKNWKAKSSNDTVEVTKFNIEHTENSPKLAKWAVFEAGEEIICTPPHWQAHTKNETLTISPFNRTDSIEGVTFSRLAMDSPKLDYNSLAHKLVENSFVEFIVQNGDTLKQLVFKRNFAYERNTGLHANKIDYKGYALVYVGDHFVYNYRIILTEARLKAYNGNLFADIIGNLQIRNQYVIDNTNPLQQLAYVRRE